MVSPALVSLILSNLCDHCQLTKIRSWLLLAGCISHAFSFACLPNCYFISSSLSKEKWWKNTRDMAVNSPSASFTSLDRTNKKLLVFKIRELMIKYKLFDYSLDLTTVIVRLEVEKQSVRQQSYQKMCVFWKTSKPGSTFYWETSVKTVTIQKKKNLEQQ